MKLTLLLFLLPISINCFSQERQPEFMLLFGNDFENDSVTIFVEGILIAKNIGLRSRMIDPRNLIIEQTCRNMQVKPYYEPKQALKKIPIKNSILGLQISLDNVWRSFKFDLRKGRFLYAEYTIFRTGWSVLRMLTIAQSKQGPGFY